MVIHPSASAGYQLFITGQAKTSERREDMEGGAHSQTGCDEEAAGQAGEEIKTVAQLEVIGRGGARLPPALPFQPFHEEESRSNAGDRPPYSGGSVAHAVPSVDNTSRTAPAVENA